jgi:hypothetical protein
MDNGEITPAVDQAYERQEKAIAYRLEEPQSEEEI